MTDGGLSITGTRWGIDPAAPLILRETTRTRLVFIPQIIENNPKNSNAYVDGVFAFQAKKPSGEWEDCDAIKLSNLKDGEGVRLNLGSEEVLELFRGLQGLFQLAESKGIQLGTAKYMPAPEDAGMRKLMETGQFRQLSGDQKIGLLGSFITWLDRSEAEQLVKRLAGADPDNLANFDAALGATRLEALLTAIRANRSETSESYWDNLLKTNSWAVSQLFAQPLVIIRGQAYVGGKTIDNQGGNVADFLFRNPFTTNPLVVEIKTPSTLLLTGPTRNTAYPPSHELVSATAQVIHARDKLTDQYRQLAGDEEPLVRAFSPGALLISGDMSLQGLSNTQKHSFELYRGAMPTLNIVTFDEIERKIELLLQLLTLYIPLSLYI